MKKRMFVFFVIAFILILIPQSKATTNVLFIGNSRTYTTNTPTRFYKMAQATGHNDFYVRGVFDGGSLEDTYQSYIMGGPYGQQVRDIKWDYVVLQEETSVQVNNREKLIRGAKKIVDELKKKNSNLKVIYNAQWASMRSIRSQQATVNANYEAAKNQIGGKIAYTGNAFLKVMDNYNNINLFTDNDVHPTGEGGYLSACMVYTTIFEKSPVGIEYYGLVTESDVANKNWGNNEKFLKNGFTSNINASTAKTLQKIAFEVMQPYLNATQTSTQTPANSTSSNSTSSNNTTYVMHPSEISVNKAPDLTFLLTDSKYVQINLSHANGIDEKSIKLYKGKTNSGELVGTISKSNSTKNGYNNYTITIPENLINTKNTHFYIEVKDGLKKCYRHEHFTLKKYKNKNAQGEYYKVDRAPRITVNLNDDTSLYFDCLEYSGLKKLDVTTAFKNNKKTILKSYNGSKSSDWKKINSITKSFPHYVERGSTAKFDLALLQKNYNAGLNPSIGNNQYKFRLVAKDKNNLVSYETVIITLK